MPPVANIAKLPAYVRAQLDQRLLESGFGDVRGASAWLAEQGYRIGKSAIADYASANRDGLAVSLTATAQKAAEFDLRCAELRLGVLQLAANVAGPDDLIAKADRLLAWVRCRD